MKKNFYEDLDLRYPEIAICLEDTTSDTGKFFIPILTPMLSKAQPYLEKNNNFYNKNLINKEDLNINPVYFSNYLELKLPKNITSAKKNDKFIVIFIGGDITKPVLIGGYEE